MIKMRIWNTNLLMDHEERLQIHKSDINTSKIRCVRCEVAIHLLNVCKSVISKTEYLQVQLMLIRFIRKGKILGGTTIHLNT